MKTVDVKRLTACIQKCFMLSLDDRLSDVEQKQMNVLGKQLRGSLINLLSATFDNDVDQVEAANQQLQVVNQRLADTNEDISKVVDTIDTVTKLVKSLDSLLLIVAKFV